MTTANMNPMNSTNPLTRCILLGFIVFLGGSPGLEAKDSLKAGRVLAMKPNQALILGEAKDWKKELSKVLKVHCYDCHGDGARKGGLAMDELSGKLDAPAIFAKWEQIFDRVDKGEMPPAKVKDRPTSEEISLIRKNLGQALTTQHAQDKGTVLRRLNRREYENTMNDLFGTTLELEEMLPEDGRSHEFDNVGEALGLSMQHMQMYLKVTRAVLDAAIAKFTDAPKPQKRVGRYTDDERLDRYLGDNRLKLEDGSVVRFSPYGYPTGMIRTANTRGEGFYRIKVRGFAYQSETPITFSVGATTFKKGVEKPIFGYFSFPPGASGKTHVVELTAFMGDGYMIQVEPYGISDPDLGRRRPKKIHAREYKGPGLAIHSVEIEGPLISEFPSTGHKLLFSDLTRVEIPPRNPHDRKKKWYKPQFEIKSTDEKTDTEKTLGRLVNAAFRRPVDAHEIVPYVKLFEAERAKGEAFEPALRTAATAVLSSPHFLFLREPAGALDDYALASRLSYFLTRTAPDAELLELARKGKLRANLRSQTERLLKHKHLGRFVTDFTEAWLNLRDMDFTIPDRTLYPEFEPYLRFSMPLETEAFLRELITGNHPVANIVKSEFAMLNDRMAEHYGIAGVTGSQFRKVQLPVNSWRGGFLSQASVMKVSSNGSITSPVVRGVYVMERILGITPTPPPPNVPGVEPDIRGASSLRELLEKHRNVSSCASCHNHIDPLGFALESFDVTGMRRDRFRNKGGDKVDAVVRGRRVVYRLGPEVDSSAKFLDGSSYRDFRDYRNYLAKHDDRLARAFAGKLLTFASGRELGFSDRTELDRIVADTAQNKHRLRDLLHRIIQSDIFLNK